MLGFDGSAFESFLELFEAAGGPGKNMARKIFNPLDAEPSVKDVELVKNHGFGLNCGEIPKCHQRTLKAAARRSISTKSLYTWRAQLSKPAKVLSDEAALAAELRQVRKELARVTEERDILKKATAYFARESR